MKQLSPSRWPVKLLAILLQLTLLYAPLRSQDSDYVSTPRLKWF